MAWPSVNFGALSAPGPYRRTPMDSNPPNRPIQIFGLAGYAQTGKDSVGKVLVERHGFRRISFADKVRELALEVDPIIGWTTLPTLRQVVAKSGWEGAKSIAEVRRFLQRLGAGARKVIGPDVWVNAATAGMGPYLYVFTDVRYPNEAAALRDYGAAIVRVIRPDFGPVNDHESETAMDKWSYDYVLPNDGPLEELPSKVKLLLEAFPDGT